MYPWLMLACLRLWARESAPAKTHPYAAFQRAFESYYRVVKAAAVQGMHRHSAPGRYAADQFVQLRFWHSLRLQDSQAKHSFETFCFKGSIFSSAAIQTCQPLYRLPRTCTVQGQE